MMNLMTAVQPTFDLSDETACWQAVLERSPVYDGVLYYGVRSTGVYCRPSCTSLRPGRAQVVFFPSWQAAEAAGFRACKRCQPRQDASPRASLVTETCRILEEDVTSAPTLAELGARLGVSPHHLQRVFKAFTGVSPRQYAAAQRLEQFKRRARQENGVNGAAYTVGYGSSRGLYEQAARQMGMTPATYARGGRGMEILYTIAPCTLGYLLVGATRRGICAVYLGDSEKELEHALVDEYPAALRRRDQGSLVAWLQPILDYLEGVPTPLDLPLDVQATAFQLRVWEALRHIPPGETRSYSEVAAAIGQPKAVRAVAHACASNPVSLVNPCHRVLRSDGSLAGYRWGLARKRALLDLERK